MSICDTLSPWWRGQCEGCQRPLWLPKSDPLSPWWRGQGEGCQHPLWLPKSDPLSHWGRGQGEGCQRPMWLPKSDPLSPWGRGQGEGCQRPLWLPKRVQARCLHHNRNDSLVTWITLTPSPLPQGERGHPERATPVDDDLVHPHPQPSPPRGEGAPRKVNPC